jgi:hypothetical protein
MKKGNSIFIYILFGAVLLSSCTSRVNTTTELVEKMISTYSGKWFREISFEQTTSFFKKGEIVRTESWCETYQYPGKLLIEFDKFGSGSGQLYRNDSVYKFTEHQMDTCYPIIHDLVVLSMDIYHLQPGIALSRIKEMGYDIDKFYTHTYNGREVYVVGASSENDTSDQFWIDKEHLYFVKMLKNYEWGIQEVVFDNYLELSENGWIEQEVRFYINGTLYMTEKYYNIEVLDNQVGNMLNPDFFQINNFYQKHPIDLWNIPDFHWFPIGDIFKYIIWSQF